MQCRGTAAERDRFACAWPAQTLLAISQSVPGRVPSSPPQADSGRADVRRDTPGVLPERACSWVTGVIGAGSRITRVWRLRPGSWHVNHAVDVIDGHGRAHRVVLRRWARRGWQDDDPDYTVEREVRVLGLVRPAPVPAPEVIAADPAGADCDVPAILLTRLPGHGPRPAGIPGESSLRQLAEALAHIHSVDAAAGPELASYRLYFDRAAAVPARWMPPSLVWEAATAAVRQPPPATTTTLIHRDYHPGNTLWSRRRLTGIVDWTQASSGPPGLDVGQMRWNLVADHGQQAADRFLDCYRAASGRALDDQSYWDLVSLLDLLLDAGDPAGEPGDITPADLQRFENYASTLLTART
jgi:aminoglycoside phosphotransferase (APT) family kinase protein